VSDASSGEKPLNSPRPLIAGNWKMNGLEADLDGARSVAAAVDAQPPAARIALCPPATLVWRMADVLAGSTVAVGGQDCRPEPSGPFTGDLAAEMFADAGARFMILGHSERRDGHGEDDALVAAKVAAALRAGLEPIVCVGESGDERAAGRALDVVTGQLACSLPDALQQCAFAVAYEPVWAIGSGRTPRIEEIEEMHFSIRAALAERFGDRGRETPILYGGSVKPANARAILAADEVGGALVGGASLNAADFIAIFRAI
jgi:triosephosphate isomerase